MVPSQPSAAGGLPLSFFTTCGCLPPTPLFVADASMSSADAASATTAAVAQLASDESICVEATAEANTAATASAAAAFHAFLLQVTDTSPPLSDRINMAQQFTMTLNRTMFMLAAVSANSASVAGAADRKAPLNGANHEALAYDVLASVNHANLAVAMAALFNSKSAAMTVEANTTSVASILTAQEIFTARHAAALSTLVASHAAACAIHTAGE